MLIDSDFHEYYDTVNSFGIDKTVVYLRKESILKQIPNSYASKLPNPPQREQFEVNKNSYVVKKMYVGFCGKIYPLITVEETSVGKTEIFYLYSADACLDFIKDKNLAKSSSKRYFFDSDYSLKSPASVKNFYASADKFKSQLEPLFQKHRCPVFIFGWDCLPGHRYDILLVLNPSLKNIKFVTVKDPFAAFQEIYMYISGVLGVPAKPMIEISDKDKQAAKGLDSKYAFKKPPGGGQWR
jgi:hypothetical protein